MNFGRTPEEIENERKRLLIHAFSGLGSIFLFVFGSLSILDGRPFLGSVLFGCFGAVIVLSIVARKINNVQPVSLFLALLLFLLSSFLLLRGGASGTGVYWSYSVSMLMVLVVGPKTGGIYMGLYIIINSIFIFGNFSFTYQYSGLESSRIIATSITLYVLILASEWIRIGSYSAISRTSESHRNMASTDSLTGLLNRHGVKEALEAKKILQPAVLILLDIDNFKKINDSYGHDFGDSVLVKLSEIIMSHTKGGDIIARWGGEEYLLILFDTELDPSKVLVSKIKNDFKNYPFEWEGASISVTFSGGISTLNSNSSFTQSITLADKKLYSAKDSGRDRIVAYL
ncbi:GGDEF domain-containing protein [Microbulbifer taiwanensis]|uniref:diguanylate cyclase n=1 Tax=Microbulbifer taiwanensis TaxID=986746 RepID=A0ABW1YUT6_9GAMM|nr:GGDEF domain-containing protein [Microbulbifer taiwanensis]